MTYRLVPCPKCDRLHGVIAVRASREERQRPGVAALRETPDRVSPRPVAALQQAVGHAPGRAISQSVSAGAERMPGRGVVPPTRRG